MCFWEEVVYVTEFLAWLGLNELRKGRSEVVLKTPFDTVRNMNLAHARSRECPLLNQLQRRRLAKVTRNGLLQSESTHQTLASLDPWFLSALLHPHLMM